MNKNITTLVLFFLISNAYAAATQNDNTIALDEYASTHTTTRQIEDDFFDALGVDQGSLDDLIKDNPELIPAPKPSRTIVFLAKLYPAFAYCMKIKRGIKTRWKRFVAAIRHRYRTTFSRKHQRPAHEQS